MKSKTASTKPRTGRPPFEPTDADHIFVARGVAYGIPQDILLHHIINPQTGKSISLPTFHRAFREDIDKGHAQTVHAVATSLVRQAIHGNVTAQIFFLKARAGWKETAVIENWFGGIAGKPIEVRVSARNQLYETLDEMVDRRRSVESRPAGNAKPNGAGPPAAEIEGET